MIDMFIDMITLSSLKGQIKIFWPCPIHEKTESPCTGISPETERGSKSMIDMTYIWYCSYQLFILSVLAWFHHSSHSNLHSESFFLGLEMFLHHMIIANETVAVTLCGL